MITDEIKAELFNMQDETYRIFQSKLIPAIRQETIIGVRTIPLRSYAKQLQKRDDIKDFLSALPHAFFDENQLHAFIISERKDYSQCMEELCAFLPYVDNWATCDQLSPKVFKKHRPKLLKQIEQWLKTNDVYTVRFAIGMLMKHFLDSSFDTLYPKMVAQIRSNEYYINMMIAWYFATALAKQYEAALPLIEGRQLDAWTHNKAIQKSIESSRIPTEHKAYLKSLKI